MEALSPNYQVVGFFAVGAAVMVFLGWRFAVAGAPVFRYFGLGLACFGAAFVVWAFIVWAHPADLGAWTTLGVVAFLPGLLFFVRAATDSWLPRNQRIAIGIGGAYLLLLFVVRTFILPSDPGFSENGLFYFNAQPLTLLLYIGAFAGALTPAVYAISQAITLRWLARTTLICFNLVIMCGVILLTSYDDELQVYNGYLMGVGLLVLVVLYLRHRPG